MCLTIGRGCKFIQTLKCCQRAQRDRSRQDTIHSHGTLSAEDASWSARGFWAFFCRVLGFILGCFHVVKEENEGNVHASTEADDVRSARPNPPAASDDSPMTPECPRPPAAPAISLEEGRLPPPVIAYEMPALRGAILSYGPQEYRPWSHVLLVRRCVFLPGPPGILELSTHELCEGNENSSMVRIAIEDFRAVEDFVHDEWWEGSYQAARFHIPPASWQVELTAEAVAQADAAVHARLQTTVWGLRGWLGSQHHGLCTSIPVLWWSTARGWRPVGGSNPLPSCLLAAARREGFLEASSWMELHAAVDDAFHSPRVAGPQFCCW